MDRPSLSLLARSAPASAVQLTSLQVSVDGLCSSFLEHATDWRSLTAMTAGGAAYRLGRVGLLGLGGGGISRAASLATGLGAEVTAFELTHRSLHSARGNPNLWRWSGSGGLAQGLLSSSVTFGSLRGAGRVAGGQNLLVQHVFQDAAMVFGHNVSGSLGASPRPTTSLAEQFLHAEATLWQMQAGMSLAHGMIPRLGALERGLDLSFPSFERRGEPYRTTSRGNFAEEAFATSTGRAPGAAESLTGPSAVWMSGKTKGSGEGILPTREGSSGSGERPRAEGSERVSETEAFWVDERSRITAESSTDGYVTINERGAILYVNPALHELLGYEKGELVGRPLTVLIPPSFRGRHEVGLRRYLQSGVQSFDHRKGVDLPALHKDGNWVPTHISFQEHARGGERFFTGTVRRNAGTVGEGETPRPARSSPVEKSVERTPLPPNPRTGDSWERAFEYSSPHELTRALKDDSSPLLDRLAKSDLYLRLTDEISPHSIENYLNAFCVALTTKIRSQAIKGTRVWVEMRERGRPLRREELVLREGRFMKAGDKSPEPDPSSPPARGASPSETSYIGLKVEREGAAASRTDYSRLQSELSSATSGFKALIETAGDIEIRIPSGLRREFLVKNTAEILRTFENRVWGHIGIIPGRKVSLLFGTKDGPFRVELEKAEVGYKLVNEGGGGV